MLSPWSPRSWVSQKGMQGAGVQVASGALGLCLGWDSDGTGDSTMGGSAPWQRCSRPQLTALRRAQGLLADTTNHNPSTPGRWQCQSQMPGQPCGYRCSPLLVSSEGAISPGSPGWSDPLPLGTWKARPGGLSLSLPSLKWVKASLCPHGVSVRRQ